MAQYDLQGKIGEALRMPTYSGFAARINIASMQMADLGLDLADHKPLIQRAIALKMLDERSKVHPMEKVETYVARTLAREEHTITPLVEDVGALTQTVKVEDSYNRINGVVRTLQSKGWHPRLIEEYEAQRADLESLTEKPLRPAGSNQEGPVSYDGIVYSTALSGITNVIGTNRFAVTTKKKGEYMEQQFAESLGRFVEATGSQPMAGPSEGPQVPITEAFYQTLIGNVDVQLAANDNQELRSYRTAAIERAQNQLAWDLEQAAESGAPKLFEVRAESLLRFTNSFSQELDEEPREVINYINDVKDRHFAGQEVNIPARVDLEVAAEQTREAALEEADQAWAAHLMNVADAQEVSFSERVQPTF